LIIYAPNPDSAELAEQRALLSEIHGGIRERDMVLIEIVGDRATVVIGPRAQLDADSVVSRAGLSKDQFGVALLGKDSGVKLRSNNVVTPPTLFALIDAMPMRQREIRDRGGP
jgi:hypothetical protein